MSHYRSDLQDLEFNLFEMNRLGDRLPDGLDPDTVRDLLREIDRFAREEWAASFTDADRNPPELVDGEVALPASLKQSIAAFFEQGWDRFGLPESLGGMEVPPSVFWAAQELLIGGNPTAAFYAGGSLFARVLFEEGTPEQQELARLWVDRRWGGTMVLTEPDAGSDVGAATTKATQVEGDLYHLEGVKRFITSGEHDAAENIIHLVLARREGGEPGTKGLSMFVVPKFLVESDGTLGERNGVKATHLEKKMGLKASATCELTFGMDRPCVGYLVGGVHDGIRQMFRVIEAARMTIGTKSAATLSTGYLNALEYARERVQGADLAESLDKDAPRIPIIRHPDVRRMLLEQKAWSEGLRALVCYTAYCLDLSESDPDMRSRNELLLPLVKGYSSEKAYELLAQSLQVLGGSGYTQDYPIEQYIRDAKIDTVYEGTTGIQGLDLFFRKIVRDQGRSVAALAGEVGEFVKATDDGDPIAAERVLLGEMLDDVQGHLGAMVGHVTAWYGGDKPEIYKAGLHTNALLESMAEVVISWLVLRQAEVMGDRDDSFAAGKRAIAGLLVRSSAPKIAMRRALAESEDGSVMALDDRAF